MDRERAKLELELMISDFENAGVPEADIAGHAIPTQRQIAEDRLRLMREDIDRSRVPDPMEVEGAIARERARRTFLTVDEPKFALNSLGEPVVVKAAAAPMAKATVEGEHLGDDVLLALGVSEGDLEPAAATPDVDILDQAFANLGQTSTEPVRMDPPPPAPGQKSFLEKPFPEVLELVASRMEPGRARETAERLAAEAREEG